MKKTIEGSIQISLSKPTSVLYVSDGIEALLGFKAFDFMSGKVSILELIHTDDRDISDDLFSNETAKPSGTFNIRLRHADNRIRCIKGHYTKAYDQTGSFLVLDLRLQDSKSLYKVLKHSSTMTNFKAMMENTDDYIYFKDKNHVFTGASQTLVQLTHPSEHWFDLLGKTDYDVFPEALADSYYTLEKQVFSGIKVAQEVQKTVDVENRSGWVDNRKYPIQDENGELIGLFGIARDITEEKRNEDVLRALAETSFIEKENVFKEIVYQLAKSHGMRYAMISLINDKDPSTADTLAIWTGDQFAANTSYSLKGTPCEKVIQKGHCLYQKNIQALFPENYLLTDMGVESYLGLPLINSEGKTIGIINISDNKPIENKTQTILLLKSLATRTVIELELQESEKKLKLSARVFSDTNEGIYITDSKGIIIDANPAFAEITGFSYEEIIGENPRILSSGQQEPQFYTEMWEAINKQGHWQGEIWNRKKSGEIYAELLTISSIKDEKGDVMNYVGISSDITRTKEQQKELELMAHYDVLTKLPNRALFYDRFLQAVAHSKRTGTLLAVCFLDLDNFKPVNDTYGHNVGDQLLIKVAERIKSNIREEDTVSRQGGDEFTLLLGGLDSFPPCEKMVARMLGELAKPYQIDDQIIDISASLGVTLYPQDSDDIDMLIRHADQAMYQAKLAGKNRYHVYNPNLDQQASLKHRRLDEIEHALTNGDLRLYYQPKVNMKTGEVYGVEALIRWLHPEKGMILPLDFLPIIEENPLEIQLGKWVIEQALGQLASWKKAGISLEVSINIASYHLQSDTFISQLKAALSKQPTVSASSLQLEILESSALGDTQVINSIIKSCQEVLEVKFALDDFGTGYSSLTHLRNLPAETIKIDQTFVRGMLDDPDDCAIVDSIIGLADSFEREVIAEGVETTEHGLMLLLMGCDHAQGYGIAKPMPAEDIPEWLISYSMNNAWVTCGNSEPSQKERRLQQLTLAITQWKKHFEAAIQADPDQLHSWPIMDPAKCPCGNWIKRESHEKLFNAQWLLDLEAAHDRAHTSMIKLKTLHQDGQVNSAISGLQEIRASLESVGVLLKGDGAFTSNSHN